MKFTVEVEEFYLEEGELALELKRQIKNDVVTQIRELVKKQVDDFMDQYIKAEIHSQLQGRVQAEMDAFLASGMVQDTYNGREKKPVKEWMAESIKGKHPDIVKVIAAQVAKAVKEMQDRYDLMFASQLITKIKDQGFLKEDVARLLLSEEGKS
jgi:hypothetical protein